MTCIIMHMMESYGGSYCCSNLCFIWTVLAICRWCLLPGLLIFDSCVFMWLVVVLLGILFVICSSANLTPRRDSCLVVVVVVVVVIVFNIPLMLSGSDSCLLFTHMDLPLLPSSIIWYQPDDPFWQNLAIESIRPSDSWLSPASWLYSDWDQLWPQCLLFQTIFAF